MSRCWALVGLLCAGALALAGCDEQPPLRVGFLAELTGRSSDLAEAGRNGVLMSIESARDGKLLKGRRVDVLIRDTGADASSAQKAAEDLVAAGVDVIIGPMTSGMVPPVQSVTENAGILLVSPSATATQFYGKDDLLVRINWTTRDNGSNYARHYHAKGLRRLSVAVNENNRVFADSWLAEFRVVFESLGGTISASHYFDSAAENYRDLVDRLLAPQPDGLLLIGNSVDVPRLAQQAYKSRPGIPMIAAEWAATSQLIELGGRSVEGLMLVQNYDQDDTSPRYVAFRDAYAKRFGKPPVFASVLGHDAASVVMGALARRPNGMTVKDAVLKFGPYQGLQQEVLFDANGDAQRTAHFMVVRDGRFVRDK
jgi:branched-chain amino acid transport system substrate-binding protein